MSQHWKKMQNRSTWWQFILLIAENSWHRGSFQIWLFRVQWRLDNVMGQWGWRPIHVTPKGLRQADNRQTTAGGQRDAARPSHWRKEVLKMWLSNQCHSRCYTCTSFQQDGRRKHGGDKNAAFPRSSARSLGGGELTWVFKNEAKTKTSLQARYTHPSYVLYLSLQVVSSRGEAERRSQYTARPVSITLERKR